MSSSVPFHCIICFDEFDTGEKPPVVLPCGHTYVCAPCSKRLDKCMECRLPLSRWSSCTTTASTPLRPRDKLGNLEYYKSPPTTQKPKQPMPKNLILLELMEASKRIASRDDDDDNDENSNINLGMQVMSSHCGTYAVKEPLSVLKQHPLHSISETTSSSDEQRDEVQIQQGQTLQVVGIERGVTKLARNEGYIVGQAQQIVKVGGPLEHSCQTEGMLHLVKERKAKMQKQLQEIEKMEQELQAKLDFEFEAEPNHPVVTKAPPPAPSSVYEDSNQENSQENSVPSSSSAVVADPQTPPRPVRVVGITTTTAPMTPDAASSDDWCGLSVSPSTTTTTTTAVSIPSTQSFDSAINWRTGMSGHRALTLRISSQPYKSQIRMMSEHDGISRVRRRNGSCTTRKKKMLG